MVSTNLKKWAKGEKKKYDKEFITAKEYLHELDNKKKNIKEKEVIHIDDSQITDDDEQSNDEEIDDIKPIKIGEEIYDGKSDLCPCCGQEWFGDYSQDKNFEVLDLVKPLKKKKIKNNFF